MKRSIKWDIGELSIVEAKDLHIAVDYLKVLLDAATNTF